MGIFGRLMGYSWQRAIPFPHLRPRGQVASALEALRLKHGLTDEDMVQLVSGSPWAAKRAQEKALAEAKAAYPDLGDREHWRLVLLSRFEAMMNGLVAEAMTGSSTPGLLSMDEIGARMERVDAIVAEFESFGDLVDYVLEMDDQEGQFLDPTGIREEASCILGTPLP